VVRSSPAHGRAVQVDPIKPTLKAPGTKRLKLKYDKLLSNFAFKFQLAPLQHDAVPEWLRALRLYNYFEVRAVQVDSIKPRVESAYGFTA